MSDRTLKQIEAERKRAEHQRQCDRWAPVWTAALQRGRAKREAKQRSKS